MKQITKKIVFCGLVLFFVLAAGAAAVVNPVQPADQAGLSGTGYHDRFPSAAAGSVSDHLADGRRRSNGGETQGHSAGRSAH